MSSWQIVVRRSLYPPFVVPASPEWNFPAEAASKELVRILPICFFLVQAATVTGVPDKPDFSGRWVLVAAQPANAAISRALTVSQSVRRTNVRGEPMPPFFDQIAIQRESADGITSESHFLGIVGGSVPGVAATGVPTSTHRTHHAAVWRDRSLVFEQAAYAGDEWTERRETWTIEPNGELKITSETSGSAEPARTVTATHVREVRGRRLEVARD